MLNLPAGYARCSAPREIEMSVEIIKESVVILLKFGSTARERVLIR